MEARSRLIAVGWAYIALLSGVGCRVATHGGMSDVDRRCFWMSWEVAESQFESLNRNYLTGVMNDPDSSDEIKRWAAVRMIARFVRPGFRSVEFGELFAGTGWLDGAELQVVGGMGGWIPVEMPMGNGFLTFLVIPNGQGRGNKPVDAVYFVLAGVNARLDHYEVASRYLRGELDDRGVVLREFAICYHDREESLCVRYTTRGLALFGDGVVFPAPRNGIERHMSESNGEGPLLDAMGNPIPQ